MRSLCAYLEFMLHDVLSNCKVLVKHGVLGIKSIGDMVTF